jgi:hypothetical protein
MARFDSAGRHCQAYHWPTQPGRKVLDILKPFFGAPGNVVAVLRLPNELKPSVGRIQQLFAVMRAIDECSQYPTNTREEQWRSPFCGRKDVPVSRGDHSQNHHGCRRPNASPAQSAISETVLRATGHDPGDIRFRNTGISSVSIDEAQHGWV